MKSSHLIFLSIYVTCIVCGFWIGGYLKQNNIKNVGSNQLPLLQTVPSLQNGQHNILIVTIDNSAEIQPKLHSIWLVTYFNNHSSINFFPISPTISNGNVKVDDYLHDNFGTIKADGYYYLTSTFLEILTQRNYWWSGYLVVDQQAFTEIANATNDPGSDYIFTGNNPTDREDLNNPDLILIHDSEFFINFCQDVTHQGTLFNWDVFRSLIPHLMSSSLDADLLIEEWSSSLTTADSPECVLPLGIYSLEPDKQ